MVKIFCVNTQTSKTFPEGTTLMDMLPSFDFVNNGCKETPEEINEIITSEYKNK